MKVIQFFKLWDKILTEPPRPLISSARPPPCSPRRVWYGPKKSFLRRDFSKKGWEISQTSPHRCLFQQWRATSSLPSRLCRTKSSAREEYRRKPWFGRSACLSREAYVIRAVNSADATSRLRTTLLQYRIGFFASTDIFHEKAFLGYWARSRLQPSTFRIFFRFT